MKGTQIKSMVENVATIICFSVMAVIFQHWWISLFSLLALFTDDLRDNSGKKKSEEVYDEK